MSNSATGEIRINPIACDGHGLCAELLPELITLDEWGFPIVRDTEVPGALASHARRAADVCPTLALLFSPRKRP
jgi:ferredoxin